MTGESISALVIDRLSMPSWQKRAAPFGGAVAKAHDMNERQSLG